MWILTGLALAQAPVVREPILADAEMDKRALRNFRVGEIVTWSAAAAMGLGGFGRAFYGSRNVAGSGEAAGTSLFGAGCVAALVGPTLMQSQTHRSARHLSAQGLDVAVGSDPLPFLLSAAAVTVGALSLEPVGKAFGARAEPGQRQPARDKPWLGLAPVAAGLYVAAVLPVYRRHQRLRDAREDAGWTVLPLASGRAGLTVAGRL